MIFLCGQIDSAYYLMYFMIFLHTNNFVHGSLGDYINGISRFLWSTSEITGNNDAYDSEFGHNIPYEISALDEKFISEAVKLTGVAISDLDSCQQRVVLKLRSDCNKMNDEELAKMAVHLLNCQSYVEARKLYPCTDEMSIKECTTDMDSDTWTSYHLMSNRARAVCYMVRQSQFRGLAERTVNRLMEASKNQLISLGRITANQESILDLAENTYQSLSKAQNELVIQQKDMQQAQLHGQLVLENNINRLVDEKRIIHETHNKLIEMTREVQNKLENSAKMIVRQNSESKINHQQLLDDVTTVQKKANELFDKIDAYSQILLKQNAEFKSQYESTLRNLREVNETVHGLVNLIGRTRQGLEERLSWIIAALGGTDEAVERLYMMLIHIGCILMSMLACSFLSARASTRLVVVALPSINLFLALYGNKSLEFLSLISMIFTFVATQALILWAITFRKNLSQAIAGRKINLTLSNDSEKSEASRSNTSVYHEIKTQETFSQYQNKDVDTEHNETNYYDGDIGSLTPPVSRNGHYSSTVRSRSRSNTPLRLNSSFKGTCRGITRAGTPCKLNSLAGRDFCYRHQHGDSILE